jgi:hypothetical protein
MPLTLFSFLYTIVFSPLTFYPEPRTQNKEQCIDAFRKIWEKGIEALDIKNIEAKK